jgi:opacity protein-like surface antigen
MKNLVIAATVAASLISGPSFADDQTACKCKSLYLGGQMGYVVNGNLNVNADYDNNWSYLSDDPADRLRFGFYIGMRDNVTRNFFFAKQFGIHLSTMKWEDESNLPQQEVWGVEFLQKFGLKLNPNVAVVGFAGYNYSKFATHQEYDYVDYNNKHAIPVGAAIEVFPEENVGIGVQYKHLFWVDYNKSTNKLDVTDETDHLGLEMNYYF